MRFPVFCQSGLKELPFTIIGRMPGHSENIDVDMILEIG
jgi:hypothetical protein